MDTMKQQGQWQGGIWQRHKNNAVYVCELKLQAYDTEMGKASRYVAILSNKQTCDSAFLDPLTNLPSRQLFRHKLLKTHAHAQRQKKLFAVLLISIDNLPVINSEYGCVIGDQLLYMIGQSLKSSVRDSDSVARYGGNLFGVNLSEIAKSQDATLVSQIILFKLTQTFFLKNKPIQGIISIGIAVYPEDSAETDTLLELAEQSMQRAKEQGGNQCHFHNPMLQQQYC
jgi:diguanylate cyclase (GGDEF)-like protein